MKVTEKFLGACAIHKGFAESYLNHQFLFHSRNNQANSVKNRNTLLRQILSEICVDYSRFKNDKYQMQKVNWDLYTY